MCQVLRIVIIIICLMCLYNHSLICLNCVWFQMVYIQIYYFLHLEYKKIININTHTHTHVCIYIYVCKCICKYVVVIYTSN